MPAPQPSNRRFFWIALAVAGLGASALVYVFFLREGAAPGATFRGPAADAAAWKRYVIEALSIETPIPFGSGPDVSGRLPEEVREMIAAWKTREAVDTATGLRVQVSHITYRDTVTVDLDGAVGGAMSEAAAALGDPAPDYSASKDEVSGLPARRVIYRRSRPAIQIEALFLQRGPHLWQIQAISTSKAARPVGERILKSVRLATADEPAPDTAPPPTPVTAEPAR